MSEEVSILQRFLFIRQQWQKAAALNLTLRQGFNASDVREGGQYVYVRADCGDVTTAFPLTVPAYKERYTHAAFIGTSLQAFHAGVVKRIALGHLLTHAAGAAAGHTVVAHENQDCVLK